VSTDEVGPVVGSAARFRDEMISGGRVGGGELPAAPVAGDGLGDDLG
jgi:hypothetical protein